LQLSQSTAAELQKNSVCASVPSQRKRNFKEKKSVGELGMYNKKKKKK
jgi:hypothetical protein